MSYRPQKGGQEERGDIVGHPYPVGAAELWNCTAIAGVGAPVAKRGLTRVAKRGLTRAFGSCIVPGALSGDGGGASPERGWDSV